jgi:hypothetical protein
MSLENEISNCLYYPQTDCSKERLVEEYLQERAHRVVNETEHSVKPGETFTFEVPGLTEDVSDFLDEYFRQLTWSQPYKATIFNLNNTLNTMSPEEASAYLRNIRSEGIQFPSTSNYNSSLKPLKNYNSGPGFLSADSLEDKNYEFAREYVDRLDSQALKHFEQNRMYDHLRELARTARRDNFHRYMQRPEVAISSKQQERFFEIFDQVDTNSDERLSDGELVDAIESQDTSANDKELLRLLKELRRKLVHSHDDADWLPEIGISQEDMKHIGEVSDEPPGRGFTEFVDRMWYR